MLARMGYMSVEDVRRCLHLSAWAAYRIIRAADLRTTKLGKQKFVLRADLERFIESGGVIPGKGMKRGRPSKGINAKGKSGRTHTGRT